MSFDPFNEPGRPGRDDSRPAPVSSPSREAARGRLMVPAILMLILALVNLLLGGVTALGGGMVSAMPKEEFEAEMRKNPNFAQIQEALDKNNKTLADVKNSAVWWCYVLGVPSVALSPLVILGAIGMLRGRWYVLAVLASVVSMIPVVSCMGCCGLGEIVGLWALIVLLSGDVKAAFR